MAAGIGQFAETISGRINRRGMLGGMLGVSALALAACGASAANIGGAAAPAAQELTATINGSIKLGPDGKMHDAFTPADFSVTQGQPVKMTVYSYDDAPHSVTAPDLQLDAQIAPSTEKGVPAVTTFTFTPNKAGKFFWNCDLPCDGDSNGWAMANPGFMSGYITVAPAK